MAGRRLSLRARGVAEILLSGFCFGFLGVLGKSFYLHGGTPGELLSFRFLISAGLLWVFWLLRSPGSLRLSRSQILKCALLGIFGYAVFSSCFFQALSGLSASLTVLLLYLYPVIVAAAAWVFFGEKIPASRLVAIPIALFGLVALVWADLHIENASALLFGLGSAVFYSLYILASSRWLVGVQALVAVTYIQTFAGLTLGALYLRDARHVSELFAATWPTVLAIALVCSVGAMSLFLAGLQKLKSWEASILSLAEPITGVVLAILLLGDHLSGLQGLGALAVLGALVFISRPLSPA